MSLFILVLSSLPLYSHEPLEDLGSTAVICKEIPKEPSEYVYERKLIYESYGLRALRGLYRNFGINLEEYPLLSLTCLSFMIIIALIIIRLKTKKKPLTIIAIFLAIITLIFINIKGKVKKLELYDRYAPQSAQKIIDPFILYGQKLIYFDNYKEFEKAFGRKKDQGQLLCHSIIWHSSPKRFVASDFNRFLVTYSHLNINHYFTGSFFPVLARKEIMPEGVLRWGSREALKITDKNTAYERSSFWQNPKAKSDIIAGLYENSHIHYINPLATTSQINKYINKQILISANRPNLIPFFNHTAIMRMDDPGAAQNAYAENWYHPELSLGEWKNIENILKKYSAKLSVGYVPAWLDDANESLGELKVSNQKITNRTPGVIYPSKDIRYYHKILKTEFKLDEQFQFLKYNTFIDCELHGYTHISPDIQSWLKASDRYSDFKWYREFLKTETFPFTQREANVQRDIIQKGFSLFNNSFGYKASTLIPPGHKTSFDTNKIAQSQGLGMLSDFGIALFNDTPIERCLSIKTYKLWEKNIPTELKSNIPLILLFHDRDISINDSSWFEKQLSFWKQAGINEFITLRELFFRLTYTPQINWDPIELIITLNFPTFLKSYQSPLHPITSAKYKFKLPQGYKIKQLPNNIKVHKEATEYQLLEYTVSNPKPHSQKIQLTLNK